MPCSLQNCETSALAHHALCMHWQVLRRTSGGAVGMVDSAAQHVTAVELVQMASCQSDCPCCSHGCLWELHHCVRGFGHCNMLFIHAIGSSNKPPSQQPSRDSQQASQPVPPASGPVLRFMCGSEQATSAGLALHCNAPSHSFAAPAHGRQPFCSSMPLTVLPAVAGPESRLNTGVHQLLPCYLRER